MNRYLRDFKGFTLVELLIAATILVLGSCSILGGLISAISLAEMARDKTMAVNDAQQVMEQIQDTTFSQITSTDWTDWAEDNGCNTLDNEQVDVAFAYPEDPAEDLLQITVTVTWQTGNRSMIITLVGLRTAG